MIPPPLSAGERSFWVWNRAEPLTPAELATLHAASVDRLYWQAGELVPRPGGPLALRRTAPARIWATGPPDGQPQIVPVVRVSTMVRSPEAFSGEALGDALRPVAAAAPDATVQLDFDCPDRLLPVYAERLRAARRVAGIRHLFITALDHWAEAPARDTLWSAVDEVFPMIYDVEKDRPPADPGEISTWEPQPVLDPVKLRARLASWRAHCPIRWHAGLPAFARVTLYDAQARSLGHLRAWDWEDVVFNPLLRLERPPRLGTTLLRATAATDLREGSVVPPGGLVAVRSPERSALRAAIADADAAGARSVVLFRLPDPVPGGGSDVAPTGAGAGGGWSLPQLTALFRADGGAAGTAGAVPRLRFSRAGDGTERYVLLNDSDTDLPPRFGEKPGERGRRGYTVEVDAPGPVWREALAGDFHRLDGHYFSAARADAAPAPTAVKTVALASRLTFWFSHLPAHASLATGLILLAPGAEHAAIRYRVAVDEEDPAKPEPAALSSWQSLP